MPTYEYRCENCGNTVEKFHPMTSTPRFTCPDCGAELHKVLATGAGIIVRGTSEGGGTAGHCGSREPCCGRETRCDTRPCDR